ncbi:hypothetical protein Tco_0146644, partial [Tanacetum coccineum]
RVRKWRDGYYLQLTLAKRLTRQATIGDEPTLIQGRGYGGGGASVVTCYDAEAVSYRLWVCLSVTVSVLTLRFQNAYSFEKSDNYETALKQNKINNTLK